MNIFDFQELIKSDRSSRNFIKNFCWPDQVVSCPKCDSLKIYEIQNNRYRCRDCHYSFTDFSGRYFGLLRLPPPAFLWVVKLFELGLSANHASKELNLSYPTAAKAFTLLRTAIFLAEGDGVFAGCSVEIDEAYFGASRRGTRGRGAKDKIAVLGIKERKGRLLMKVIEEVSSVIIGDVITEKVEKGTLIYTDKFNGYNELRALGYRHKKINHRYGFVNGHTHTNGIEGAWSFVKEGLAKHHGVRKKNFPLYLMEQQFRFNNRESDVFTLLVEKMCNFVPRGYKSPIKNSC
jgi:transposase